MLLGLGCRSLAEGLEFADDDPDDPESCRQTQHDCVQQEVPESVGLVSLHGKPFDSGHYTPCNSCELFVGKFPPGKIFEKKLITHVIPTKT